MGSNSIISSRLVQRMISDPAIQIQLGEAQLPNQAIGLFRTSPFASSLRVAATSYELLIIDPFLHPLEDNTQKFIRRCHPGNVPAPSLEHSEVVLATCSLTEPDMPERRLDQKRAHKAIAPLVICPCLSRAALCRTLGANPKCLNSFLPLANLSRIPSQHFTATALSGPTPGIVISPLDSVSVLAIFFTSAGFRARLRLFDISAASPVEADTEAPQPMALMAVVSKLIRQSREVDVVRRRPADVVTP